MARAKWGRLDFRTGKAESFGPVSLREESFTWNEKESSHLWCLSTGVMRPAFHYFVIIACRGQGWPLEMG